MGVIQLKPNNQTKAGVVSNMGASIINQQKKQLRRIDALSYCFQHGLTNVIELLLKDQTLSHRAGAYRPIIWANDDYTNGLIAKTSATDSMYLHTVKHVHATAGLKPRSLKSKEVQKERTKKKAEVFTPTWVVKKQNDAVDENYATDDLETYLSRTWLEITCGEAPYMATRYDMETAAFLQLQHRVGFIDRKLSRLSKELPDTGIVTIAEWHRLAVLAYKSSYGFEWSGDSLLLARLNCLFTYVDYFVARWGVFPTMGMLMEIAEVISYNVWQMDGLAYVQPLSQKEIEVQVETKVKGKTKTKTKIEKTTGIPVMVMDWTTNRFDQFNKGLKE